MGMDNKDLIKAIEAHAELRGLPPGAITRRALGYHGKYKEMKAGGGITLKNATKLLDWIDKDRREFTFSKRERK